MDLSDLSDFELRIWLIHLMQTTDLADSSDIKLRICLIHLMQTTDLADIELWICLIYLILNYGFV